MCCKIQDANNMKSLSKYITESLTTKNGIDIPSDDIIPKLIELEKSRRNFIMSKFARDGCMHLSSSDFNKLGKINLKDGVIDYIKSQQYSDTIKDDEIKYIDKHLPNCTTKEAIQLFWSNDLSAFENKFKNIDKHHLYTIVLPYFAEVTYTIQYTDGWSAYAEYMLLNKK